jgi:hypothetical protein
MTTRAAGLLRDVHRLALAYHWSEAAIWSLPLRRRFAYLMELEGDADSELLSGLVAGAEGG